MGGGKSGKLPLGRTGGAKRLKSNFVRAKKKFGSTHDGYIKMNRRRNGRYSGFRTSRDPQGEAKKLFRDLSHKGRTISLRNGEQLRSYFKNGVVTYRKRSSDGSAVVEINLSESVAGVPSKQKIHFVKG